MTLKQNTNQYDELKMEKRNQASGLGFKWAVDSTFQAIAKSPVLWPSLIAGISMSFCFAAIYTSALSVVWAQIHKQLFLFFDNIV